MTTRYTCTITTQGASDGPTRASECQCIADMLQRAAQVIQSTRVTSGTITDRNGNGSLTFTYTPTAGT
jgi:hypothetical protein